MLKILVEIKSGNFYSILTNEPAVVVVVDHDLKDHGNFIEQVEPDVVAFDKMHEVITGRNSEKIRATLADMDI